MRTQEPASYMPHAAMRWARLVAGVLNSPVDLRTLEEWARHMAVSRSALKAWCGLAGASPRRSLLLGRILRAVEYRRRGTSYENALDIRDRRTFRKLFELAGHPDASDPTHGIVMKQHLIDDPELTAALLRVIGDDESASAQTWRPVPIRDGQPLAVAAVVAAPRPW